MHLPHHSTCPTLGNRINLSPVTDGKRRLAIYTYRGRLLCSISWWALLKRKVPRERLGENMQFSPPYEYTAPIVSLVAHNQVTLCRPLKSSSGSTMSSLLESVLRWQGVPRGDGEEGDTGAEASSPVNNGIHHTFPRSEGVVPG